jgi:hypothetical protein
MYTGVCPAFWAKDLSQRELNLLDPSRDLLFAREMEAAQAQTIGSVLRQRSEPDDLPGPPNKTGPDRQGDCRDDGITLR